MSSLFRISFKGREKLENLLYEHGGVAYNLNMNFLDDTVCPESD